jgi:hypothetical protein
VNCWNAISNTWDHEFILAAALGLAVVRPQWTAERLRQELDRPCIVGVKVYYTLYLYEALRSLRQACESLHLPSQAVEDILAGNAERLIRSVEQEKIND